MLEPYQTTIVSERLILRSMTPPFLQASLTGDRARAEELMELTIPDEWFEETELIALRLKDLQRDPELQPWLLRAIGLREQGRMIGHIGFHTQPDPPYLANLAPGGIEFGYTIFSPFRRHGYAYEAAQALMGWAREQHSVSRFVVAISPQNVPSLELARKLGFVRIGSQIDEEEGIEDIFELQQAAF